MAGKTNYRRLYDRLAPFYAPAMRLLPMWRRYTEAVLPYLPEGGAILEIGPGPGVLLRTLSVNFPFAAGLDLSPGMLRRAQHRLSSAGLQAGLVRADAVHLPFAAACFDAVVLTFAFSAIPDGQIAMNAIARVLRPGGVVSLVDAWDPGADHRVAHWLARLWERFGDYMRDEAVLMRSAGLDVIEQYAFGAFNSIRLTVGAKPG
jgi:phosphatidylethanolamine/phosphatidyl-N-methylethanolamine N-methyltransferase